MTPQYKPVFALDVNNHPVRYEDIRVFYLNCGKYREVNYIGWHTEGTTWIGGTLDIDFGEGDEEKAIQIDPYSSLYVIDQDTCRHTWEEVGLGENRCMICCKRQHVEALGCPEPQSEPKTDQQPYTIPTEAGITIMVCNQVNGFPLPGWYVLEIDPNRLSNNETIWAHGPHESFAQAEAMAFVIEGDLNALADDIRLEMLNSSLQSTQPGAKSE